jgi:hypothetical protein
MAKAVHDDVLDAALDKVATCTRMDVCTSQPTTLTEATSTFSLANYTLTAGDGNGDYVVSNGDTNGRKVRVLAQTGATAGASGTAGHIALTDGTSVLYVTTCGSQAITSGNTVNASLFDIEIADPT